MAVVYDEAARRHWAKLSYCGLLGFNVDTAAGLFDEAILRQAESDYDKKGASFNQNNGYNQSRQFDNRRFENKGQSFDRRPDNRFAGGRGDNRGEKRSFANRYGNDGKRRGFNENRKSAVLQAASSSNDVRVVESDAKKTRR